MSLFNLSFYNTSKNVNIQWHVNFIQLMTERKEWVSLFNLSFYNKFENVSPQWHVNFIQLMTERKE